MTDMGKDLQAAYDDGYKAALKKLQTEDAISRQALIEGWSSIAKAKAKSDAQKALMGRCLYFVEQLPSVTPKVEPCEDAISRKQAVYIASGFCHPSNIADELAKLPSVTPKAEPCDDAISRQAVLESIFDDDTEYTGSEICNMVRNLPSVNPQPICEEREKGECPYYAG